jgi:hypothetical protein
VGALGRACGDVVRRQATAVRGRVVVRGARAERRHRAPPSRWHSLGSVPSVVPTEDAVTPDFPKKTKCISYVCQDKVYTHMIDVKSEISINSNKNVQEFNHYIISLLHSDDRLEGLYNDQTITMMTQLHLHLPQAHDWGHASLRTPRSRSSTRPRLRCSPLNSGKQG